MSARPDKIPHLRPAFNKDGTVTAANASAISDGAAALVLMRKSEAEKRGLRPIAKIVSSAAHAHAPENFTTAPVPAMQKALQRAGWTKDDVDLWEINEAFASVVLRYMKDLDLDIEVTNVNGGSIAMGHPLGATGGCLVSVMLDELERRGAKRAMLSLCVGGGMGISTIIERV